MMGITRKFLLINLGIIFLNAAFGMFMHMFMMNYKSPVRERYVQLAEDMLINDPQLTDDFRVSDPPFSSNETGWGGGCQNLTDRRSPVLDSSRGLLDKSRQFKIHPFSVTGENWAQISDSWHICLSTQTSADLLFWISKQAEMWEGPMSVSVFTPDVDYTIAIKMIRYLQTCFPDVRARVAFHFVYPKGLPPRYSHTDEDHLEYDCDQPEAVNNAFLKEIRTDHLKNIMKKAPYPQNLLRNLARHGCYTEYSFTPDVDMISIPGISSQLNEFVSRNSTRACDKCAYIIPTYEIHSKVTTNPVNKNELRTLLKRRKAQRFHIKAFPPNQANSRLQTWERIGMAEKLGIMYNVTTWKNYWEPIYIAKATVPLYDERFVGYGFTRNSQVYEMHVADYSWYILNNAFLCHRGFQSSKGRNAIRKAQIKNNSAKYKDFRKEIYARYGKNEEDYDPKKKSDNKKTKETPPKSENSDADQKSTLQAKDDVPEKEKKTLLVPKSDKSKDYISKRTTG